MLLEDFTNATDPYYIVTCNSIPFSYNRYHDEKFAKMGTEEQIRMELASFLAHAAADTYGEFV